MEAVLCPICNKKPTLCVDMDTSRQDFYSMQCNHSSKSHEILGPMCARESDCVRGWNRMVAKIEKRILNKHK